MVDLVVELVVLVTHGNFRGNRSRTYYHDSSKNYSYVPKDSHSYHENTKNAQHALYDNGKFQNHMVMLKVKRIHQE